MTATTTEATMTAQPGPNGPDPAPEPLGPGWIAVTVVIGVMAALIAVAGMVLSFHAVSLRMTPSFGPRWAWLVPLVVDLTVLVFSGVDLVLNRLGMSHPLARATVYGATFGTVALNYAAGGDPAGRIAHVLMPSVWVMFVEIMRHVVRRVAQLGGATLREPIPAARWFLSPWPTLKLWRRMVLWRVNSYTDALAQERVRLTRVAAMHDEHGRAWRWKVSALDRLSIGLGEAETRPAARGTDTPAPDTQSASQDDTPAVSRKGRDDTPPKPRPKTRRVTASPAAPRGTVPFPPTDRVADLAALRGTQSAWDSLTKVEAVRAFDAALPGRTASQVTALLYDLGVSVEPVYVRKVRSRDRQADNPPDGPDDQAESDETSRSA